MGSKARSTLDGHPSYAPRLVNKKSQLTFSAACIVDSSQHWYGSGVYSSVILSGDMQWYWMLCASSTKRNSQFEATSCELLNDIHSCLYIISTVVGIMSTCQLVTSLYIVRDTWCDQIIP